MRSKVVVRELLRISRLLSGQREAAKYPEVKVFRVGSLSRQRTQQLVDRLASIEQECEALRAQFASVIKRLEDLGAEFKAGTKELKDAAKQMEAKQRYVVETKNAILRFQAYVQRKAPGVAQILADPQAVEPGSKAGDFFGRVAEQLGQDISDEVAEIYWQTKEDLMDTAKVVQGFQIVSKATKASERDARISDVVVSLKDWLVGHVDAITKKVLGFGGDIVRWAKAFAVRTGMVKNSRDAVDDAIKSLTKSIDGFVPD